MVGEDGQENVPHREWLRIFDKIMNEVKDDMKQQGREDEFIGARVRNLSHSVSSRSPSIRSSIRPSASSHLQSWSGTLRIASL
jgi:hypothetical protein